MTSMVEVDDYLMISALQHYAYCPRQCALIHVEKTWDENLYTMRGNRVHEVVNIPEDELIDGVRVERAMPLWSHRWGLTGIADVVEFQLQGSGEQPYPVEYKVGSRKLREADSIQLCAQALCLEEMLNCRVTEGAIFHHKSRRRRVVKLDEGLRSRTQQVIIATRQMLEAATLPPPVADARCPDCSLIESCLPYALQGFASSTQKHDLFAVADDPD